MHHITVEGADRKEDLLGLWTVTVYLHRRYRGPDILPGNHKETYVGTTRGDYVQSGIISTTDSHNRLKPANTAKKKKLGACRTRVSYSGGCHEVAEICNSGMVWVAIVAMSLIFFGG